MFIIKMHKVLMPMQPLKRINHLWIGSGMLLDFKHNSRFYSSKTATVSSIPDFGDHVEIFRHHSIRELSRAVLVLHLCGVETLVTNSYKLLKVGERILGQRGLAVVTSPLYRQFVAGNSGEELRRACARLEPRAIRLMIAPMLETDVGEKNETQMFSTNLMRMVKFLGMTAADGSIAAAPGSSPPAPAVCQAKVTGHISADIMEKVSKPYSAMDMDERLKAVQWTVDVMTTLDTDMNLKKESHGNDTCDILNPKGSTISEICSSENSPLSGLLMSWKGSECDALAKASPFSDVLNSEEMNEFLCGLRRFSLFGMLAEDLGIAMAVDAEFTYVNPCINLVSVALMVRNNKLKPVIWNTYQGYLTESRQWLEEDAQLAERLGCCFGVKLVRGAYMDHERLLAKQNGQLDPVQPTYDATNRNYDGIAEEQIMAVHKNPDRRLILLASHNEDTVKKALGKLSSLPNLPPTHGHHLCFAQIYGMGDNITMPLASSGALVYKSVPLGTVSEVLPYLARRASENRSVLQGARREKQLLMRALRDRMMMSSRAA
uniref:Proline dehydrogenase n=1 Tax=Hirondellea gigas TaxID=1518452 RepID=A0A2P2I5C5_9CRUS